MWMGRYVGAPLYESDRVSITTRSLNTIPTHTVTSAKIQTIKATRARTTFRTNEAVAIMAAGTVAAVGAAQAVQSLFATDGEFVVAAVFGGVLVLSCLLAGFYLLRTRRVIPARPPIGRVEIVSKGEQRPWTLFEGPLDECDKVVHAMQLAFVHRGGLTGLPPFHPSKRDRRSLRLALEVDRQAEAERRSIKRHAREQREQRRTEAAQERARLKAAARLQAAAERASSTSVADGSNAPAGPA